MLENGILIPVDKKEAFKCYKSAASKGSNEAVNKYAEMIYKSEVETIENEKEELLKYLEIVDVNNDGSPMKKIEDMLYYGNVVPSNKEEVMKYYKLAIEKGNDPVMVNLAYMFELGDGVPVDFEKALKYYKMSIDKEEPVAFNNYAYMLENGEGLEK